MSEATEDDSIKGWIAGLRLEAAELRAQASKLFVTDDPHAICAGARDVGRWLLTRADALEQDAATIAEAAAELPAGAELGELERQFEAAVVAAEGALERELGAAAAAGPTLKP
jgi:hypothetical protein